MLALGQDPPDLTFAAELLTRRTDTCQVYCGYK